MAAEFNTNIIASGSGAGHSSTIGFSDVEQPSAWKRFTLADGWDSTRRELQPYWVYEQSRKRLCSRSCAQIFLEEEETKRLFCGTKRSDCAILVVDETSRIRICRVECIRQCFLHFPKPVPVWSRADEKFPPPLPSREALERGCAMT